MVRIRRQSQWEAPVVNNESMIGNTMVDDYLEH